MVVNERGSRKSDSSKCQMCIGGRGTVVEDSKCTKREGVLYLIVIDGPSKREYSSS